VYGRRSPALAAKVADAFAGQPGYASPIDANSDKALDEVFVFRRAGYRPIIGRVGRHPLHHTRLDTPANSTAPATLFAV